MAADAIAGRQSPDDAAGSLLVSVVIPTFNRTKLLRRALRGVCTQSLDALGGFEVIVVDNAGGADGVVADVSAQFPDVPLRYVHETGPGISHARNRGVAEARGEWIVFLDDDQAPTPGWLAALVGPALRSGADAAFGPVTAEFAQSDCADERLAAVFRAYFSRHFALADGADITARSASLGTQNSAFRRRCFDIAGFQPELGRIGGEDSVLIRQLRLAGCRFVYAADALVGEHVPPHRLTETYVCFRRLRDGQIRSFACLRASPHAWGELAAYMLGGAAQMSLGAARWALGNALGRAPMRMRGRSALYGGLGKLLWMERYLFPMYGAPSGTPLRLTRALFQRDSLSRSPR